MSTWKRWSLRYRVGALFALMLVLQGASCPLDVTQRTTYPIRGVGNVIPELFKDDDGRVYFLLEQTTPGGARGFRRIYQNDFFYSVIYTYFWRNQDTIPVVFDRAGIPGAIGTAPTPPVN